MDRQLLDDALASLSSPKNEPLNWLCGEALRQHLGWPTHSHFVFEALLGQRRYSLTRLNAWIDEFRTLLKNPEAAPIKALADLRSAGPDANDKLRALVAEVQAVLELRDRGFADFEVVPPSTIATPDFRASFEGRQARIEVKNLSQPTDHIQTIASHEWEEQKKRRPDKYNINVVLKHSHRGAISSQAERRLRNLIAELPNMKESVTEILEGDVDISIERLDQPENSENILIGMGTRSPTPGQIVIGTSFTERDFEFDLSAAQALFLKSIRVVVEANRKFFAKGTSDPSVLNVMAVRGKPPTSCMIRMQSTLVRAGSRSFTRLSS